MGGWIIFAIIAAVIALLLLTPIRLRFWLTYNNEAEGGLSLKYGFIPLFSKDIPDEGGGEDKPEAKKPEKDKKDGTEPGAKKEKKQISPMEILGFAKRNMTAIKRLIGAVLKFVLTRSIKLDRLRLRLVMGVDDAMNTAMIFGAASALVFNTVGLIDRHMRLGSHSINIKPAFNEPHIFADIETVVSTCIFNLLAIVAIALWHAAPIAWRFRKEIIKNGKSD